MVKKNVSRRILDVGKALLLPLGVYLVFVVLTGGRFGNGASIISLLRTAVVPILLGMAMSFGMSMGMWDFSAGAVVYATAIFSANLAEMTGLGIPGICLFSVVIAVCFEIITGTLYNKLRIPCIVLSLGLAMVIEALPSLLISSATGRINLLDGYLADSPWCFIIVVVMFAVFYYINNQTTIGANMKAIGANISVANNAGVNIDRTKFLSFVLSGVFLGIAAIEFLSVNVSVVAVTGFVSAGMIFDSMMGIFIAGVLAKYINYSFATIIGIITIRMLGSGLVACGLSSQVRSIMTGLFLFVVLTYSANAGVLDSIKQKRKNAEDANRELS